MNITLKTALISVLLTSVYLLCGCTNTAHGLSQDINHASDSIDRAINS